MRRKGERQRDALDRGMQALGVSRALRCGRLLCLKKTNPLASGSNLPTTRGESSPAEHSVTGASPASELGRSRTEYGI